MQAMKANNAHERENSHSAVQLTLTLRFPTSTSPPQVANPVEGGVPCRVHTHAMTRRHQGLAIAVAQNKPGANEQLSLTANLSASTKASTNNHSECNATTRDHVRYCFLGP
jgi:hypothetical protein